MLKQRHFSEAPTIAASRAQLAMLLTGATDEKLAAFTVDGLARMNRTPKMHIAAMLAAELVARRG